MQLRHSALTTTNIAKVFHIGLRRMFFFELEWFCK